jgi:hypothetical protein
MTEAAVELVEQFYEMNRRDGIIRDRKTRDGLAVLT